MRTLVDDTLSAVVLSLASGPSGDGSHGTDMAEASRKALSGRGLPPLGSPILADLSMALISHIKYEIISLLADTEA